MPTVDLRPASAVLVDPDAEARRTLGGMLRALGFGAVAATGSAAQADLEDVDLAVVSLDLPGAADLLARIRQRRIEADPFAAIVATASSPGATIAGVAAAAGADALLAKPFDAGILGRTVEAIVLRRRPWIVTAAYVGPDRRSAKRVDGMAPSTVDAPNPLRMRSEGASREEVRAEREMGWQAVGSVRAGRIAFAVLFVVTAMEIAAERRAAGAGISESAEAALSEDLARLPDLLERLEDTLGPAYAVAAGGAAKAAVDVLRRSLRPLGSVRSSDQVAVAAARAAAVEAARITMGRLSSSVDHDARRAARGFLERLG